MQQVAISEDFEPFEAALEDIESLQRYHGDSVASFESGGVWYFQLRKNAVVYIPKAARFDRFVAGQVPKNFNAEVYGIPADIANQVDPVTLYTLISTVEALVSAGVTDPYEFYRYVHLAELGNTLGGGMGGMKNIRSTFRERMLEQTVAADALQETFINTVPAWINMLLLSSAGPIKTPVGACATAVESVELGVEAIASGKARVVVVGGFEDFSEESA